MSNLDESRPDGPSPYCGLTPFTEHDASFFFGRMREAERVCDSLLAFRTTVLHGPSGVGKSSLLRAAVVPRLRQMARASDPPEFAVMLHAAWHDDPVDAIAREATVAVGDLVGVTVEPGDLSETLRRCSELLDGDLLVILDQFEEYFTYHDAVSSGDSFLSQLGRVTRDDQSAVSFLLAIREDALWRLDALKGLVPGIFQNVLRLQELDERAAREAIEGPLAAYNMRTASPTGFACEPALVDALVDEIAVGEVSEPGMHRRVEASMLQLVLSRLWEEESSAGSQVLRLSTLRRLGGPARISHSYVAAELLRLSPRRQELAADALRVLVLPSGSKIALTAEDLAVFANHPVDELEPVLAELATLRLLRPVVPAPGREGPERWELYHDLLAEPVLEWCRSHREAALVDQERSRLEAIERRDARLRNRLARAHAAIAVLLVALAVLAALLLAA